MADPNQPNKWGVRHRVLFCSVLSGGTGWREANRGLGGRWVLDGEKLHSVLFVFIYCFYQYYSYLSFFLPYAVLLNYLYPSS